MAFCDIINNICKSRNCLKRHVTNSWSPFTRMTAVTLFLGILLHLLDSTDAVDKTVTHRTSEDIYMNPCKARAFSGDIALSDEEYKAHQMAARKRYSLSKLHKSSPSSSYEIQVEDPGIYSANIPPLRQSWSDYKKQLITNKSILKKMLKVKQKAIRARCLHESKKQCRLERSMLRAELRKARAKWRKLRLKFRQLRAQERMRAKLERDEMAKGFKTKWGDKKGRDTAHPKSGTKKPDNVTKKDIKKKFDFKKKRKTKSGHSRLRRAATAKKHRLWDFGVVPFVIGGNFSGNNKALFKLAMRHWENYTCITFKEKEPEDQNYITFTVEPCGCCSFVGKRGNGAQAISIGKNCDKFGIVVHELGHVIGFWHEHTRLDRDDHVQIIYKNIIPGQEYNFNKLTAADVNSLGETYDFGSIMHYARNTFARNTYLDTILPKRKPGIVVRPEIGQRVRLSPGDIRQANKLYKCPTCGRTLQESSAQFSHSPTQGRPELCQWRISATHGEKIVLNISMLGIPNSYNCETDYLEVRDGHYIKSPLLGRFCGDILPDTLTSSGTRMWIEYRTRNGGGKGFTANYEAMCGGEITKEEGFLTSPNYPDDYRPNKACTWKISVKEEFTVALKFQSFEIEKHDDCVYDYLEVRDGPDETSPLIGNYCGYKIPEDIQSSGKDLYVKFVSDGSVQKAGFYAVFVKEFDECSKFDHGCDHVCVNTLGSYRCSCRIGYELHSDGKRCEDACGGYIDQENGTITSPSYPDLYPPNKNCVWQIVAPEDHKININFTHFDIEGHNQDCEYDSVRVSSGLGSLLKLHGVFCGYTFPAPVTSEGNILRIEFNSDNSVQKTGFTATYMTDKDECSVNNGGCQHVCKNTVGSYQCACHNGFTLHDDLHGCKEGGCQFDIKYPYGLLNSPNFPENYPSRKDCVWHFTTVPGHRIRLKFKTFELEPHQECTYDHVVVFDGDDNSARSLGKFCGALVPEPVVSSGNRMFMLFFSDASVERKGFEAEHDTVCGAHLFATGTAQGLVSHARYGDHNYDNRADCEWKIQAKEGHTIQLRFVAFDLEDEAECGYDLVQVHDGLKSTDDIIGTFCGSEVPDPIESSSEYLLVRFKSDDTINWKGFSATYQLSSSLPDYVESKEIYDLQMGFE